MLKFTYFKNSLWHPEIKNALHEATKGYAFWGLLGLGFGWSYCYGQAVGHGVSLQMFLNWVFFMLLATLTLTDLKKFLIPDVLLIPLFALGIIFTNFLTADLLSTFILGAGFALVRLLGSKLAGQEAMGWGDVKLVAALGPWVGLIGIVPFLLVVSLTALLTVIIRFCLKKRGPMPFGPFLAFGGWVAYAYGPMIAAYLIMFRQYLVEAL